MWKFLTPVEYNAAKNLGHQDRQAFFSCTKLFPEQAQGSKIREEFRHHFPTQRLMWLFDSPWHTVTGDRAIEAIAAYYSEFHQENDE
jgi:hypothetical protein